MEIASLLDTLATDGTLNRITTNPLAQFGTAQRQYLGARYLPERTVPTNMFRETKISYRTVIANNGDRYSPAQKKSGKLIGHFDVILADNDIADDFTGAEYDALIQYITPLGGTEAAAVAAANQQINRWVDAGINLPMVELNEKQRWEAMVAKAVVITGDNGYIETINYPKWPDLVRVGSDWTDPTVDPFVADIFPMIDALAARGVTVREIPVGQKLLSTLATNPKVQARASSITISGGAITAIQGRASLEQMNAAMAREGFPPFTRYDLQYRTQTGSGFFLQRNAMVFIGASENEERIDLGDGQYRSIEGTLGYHAIGRGVGRPAPGRFILVEAMKDKPPRVQGQGWQTSLPVIQQPELIGVITVPTIPAQ